MESPAWRALFAIADRQLPVQPNKLPDYESFHQLNVCGRNQGLHNDRERGYVEPCRRFGEAGEGLSKRDPTLMLVPVMKGRIRKLFPAILESPPRAVCFAHVDNCRVELIGMRRTGLSEVGENVDAG